MRVTMLIGLLVFAWSPAAQATDCTRWRGLDPEAKRSEVEGMIAGHLGSNVSKRYTSESRVAMQRCLRGFVGEIIEEIDEACSQRPRAKAEHVDDIFDRFLLSCI